MSVGPKQGWRTFGENIHISLIISFLWIENLHEKFPACSYFLIKSEISKSETVTLFYDVQILFPYKFYPDILTFFVFLLSCKIKIDNFSVIIVIVWILLGLQRYGRVREMWIRQVQIGNWVFMDKPVMLGEYGYGMISLGIRFVRINQTCYVFIDTTRSDSKLGFQGQTRRYFKMR